MSLVVRKISPHLFPSKRTTRRRSKSTSRTRSPSQNDSHSSPSSPLANSYTIDEWNRRDAKVASLEAAVAEIKANPPDMTALCADIHAMFADMHEKLDTILRFIQDAPPGTFTNGVSPPAESEGSENAASLRSDSLPLEWNFAVRDNPNSQCTVPH
ncbi:hypothetical protein B0H12DRAFT_1233598 [Mycena haematopus]|nr:hypothetical protein B0H12DRAFT_1233598 [Mycena haematopus]